MVTNRVKCSTKHYEKQTKHLWLSKQTREKWESSFNSTVWRTFHIECVKKFVGTLCNIILFIFVHFLMKLFVLVSFQLRFVRLMVLIISRYFILLTNYLAASAKVKLWPEAFVTVFFLTTTSSTTPRHILPDIIRQNILIMSVLI